MSFGKSGSTGTDKIYLLFTPKIMKGVFNNEIRRKPNPAPNAHG
jgi:hypothetical protein